jgi:hypothetical protein
MTGDRIGRPVSVAVFRDGRVRTLTARPTELNEDDLD